MDMIDFHMHVLPAIDDGSRDTFQSLRMLRLNKQHGVETLVASPHFYLHEGDIESFLARREEAFARLEAAARKTEETLPKVIRGAEVLLVSDLLEQEKLEALCIEGTRYMILELPYSYWTNWVSQAVTELVDNREIVPIIAHVDRYPWVVKDPNCLLPFLEAGAVLQINARTFLEHRTRRFGLKLLAHNMAHVLGSDAHGDVNRPPNVWMAADVIRKAQGAEALEKMENRGKKILSGQMLSLPKPIPFKKGLFL